VSGICSGRGRFGTLGLGMSCRKLGFLGLEKLKLSTRSSGLLMSPIDDLAVRGLEGGSVHDSMLVVGVRCGNLEVVGLGVVDNESQRGERGAEGALAKGGSALMGNCGNWGREW
jgi:hypothetical protein